MLNDTQLSPVLTSCDRCKGEIYNEYESEQDEYGHVYCSACRDELAAENERAELAVELLEAVDGELVKYLSDDLRNRIYNAVAKRLKVS